MKTASSSAYNATRKLTKVVTILVVAIVVVAFGTSAVLHDGPSKKMIISATLKDASPLLNGNDVRLKGVRVGKIADISIVNGGARLMLELDASALPVYKNATVTSRPVSLLGERYVDLDPGTPSSGVMADGGTIVGGNAKSSTDLDQVLNTLDQPTSKDLAALVTALGTGLDGNGKNTDDAIKALLPAMTDTDKLMKVLKAQNKTLGSLVDSLEPVASGLSVDESKSLDKLVGSTRDVLQTTAINEKAFRQLMAQLPATMSSARRTLEQLQGTSDAAVPVLDRLRPTTDNLMQISRELLAFADATDPALRSANPVLRKAEKLIVAATPVAEELRKQGPAMKSSVTSLDSLTAKLAPNFTSVMEFLRGWALATNGKDGLGHYFRAGLVVDPAGVTGLIPGLPTPDQTPAGNSPDTTQGAPISGSSAEDAPASKLENLLSGLLSPKTSTDGGVTGLTAHQEQGALAFLLGGN